MSGTSFGGGDSPLVRLGFAEEEEDGDASLGFRASTSAVLALTRLFLKESGGSGREEDEEEDVALLFMEGSAIKKNGQIEIIVFFYYLLFPHLW